MEIGYFTIENRGSRILCGVKCSKFDQFFGVVSNDTCIIYTTDNRRVEVRTKDIVNIKSCRLDSEVRTALTNIYKANESFVKTMEELQAKKKASVEKLNAATAQLKKSTTGYNSDDELNKDLVAHVSSSPFLANLINHGYSFEPGYSNGMLTDLTFRKRTEIARWPNPEKFSFLMREYDNNIMFGDRFEEDAQYKKLVKQYSANDAVVPKKKIKKLNINSDQYLSLSDKTLDYNNSISVCFEKPIAKTCVGFALMDSLIKSI